MSRTMLRIAASAIAVCLSATLATAGDYDGLTVSAIASLDGFAGPANTAMLLSPDGMHLLHIDVTKTCAYELTTAGPQQSSCGHLPGHPGAPEDMFWSPNGTSLLWPSYGEAFERYRDTDVQTLDPATLVLTNLTDDGVDGSIRKGKAELDTSAQWLDADTIVFVRHSIPAGDSSLPKPAALMSMKVGAEPRKLAQLTDGEGLVIAMAAKANPFTVAYLRDDTNPQRRGVYLIEPEGSTPRRVAMPMDADEHPGGVAFSADGKYFVVLGRMATGIRVTLVEVATGAVTRLFDGDTIVGVAWSPTGSALAYVVNDLAADHQAGLYLAEPPAGKGRLLHEGAFMPPVCCGMQPIVWAINDTMILGNTQQMDRPYLLHFAH